MQVVEGMKFDRGYISPYFVTDPKTMKAELDDPFILIAEKKISSCGARPVPFCKQQATAHHVVAQQCALMRTLWLYHLIL